MASKALNPRVLIADDNPELLEMLEHLICTSGYRCDTAIDGQEAITKIGRAIDCGDPYKLLILDAAMPYATGFEVARYTRMDRHDSVPIVILTAYDEAITNAHASYVEADLVVQKPFEPTDLMRVLRLAKVEHPQNERIAARVIHAVRAAHHQ